MTTEIYVQTTSVNLSFDLPIGRHLGIWIVQDGITTVLNGISSELFNNQYNLIPPNNLPNPQSADHGNIAVRKDIVNGTPDNDIIKSFNLNKIDLTNEEASNAAQKILSYYNNLGTEYTLTVDQGTPEEQTISVLDTGFVYEAIGPNSNSVVNTLLSSAGIDLHSLDLYHNGDSTSVQFSPALHIGHSKFIDGDDSDVLTVFSSTEVTNYFHDSSGNDYLIIENGATIDISKDTDAGSWNNVVLSGYTTIDNLYLANEFGDLEIRDGNGIFFNDIVDIHNHFDTSGGFNTKYLFVVDGDVTAANIDTATDTITGATVLKQIDTRLLEDVDWGFFERIALKNVHTALDTQPNITGSTDTDFIFGNDADNVLTGSGGSDIIYGGSGNDLLTISANDESQYSYVDGGSDIDTFVYTGSTNVLAESNAVTTQSSFAENVELIRIGGTSTSQFIYAESRGWDYDLNGSSYMSWVDYASSSMSLEIDLSMANWEVRNTTNSDKDTFLNASNTVAQFIGTTHGDTITIGDLSGTVWLGTGDDTVNVSASSSKNINLYYSGGADSVDAGDLIDAVKFDSSIDDTDVSYTEINKGPETAVYSSGGNLFKDYSFDLKATVTGKGSITLDNLTGTIGAGSDAIFNTADDTYSRTGPAFQFWGNTLDTTPYGSTTITGTGASTETLRGYGGSDTMSANSSSTRAYIYGNGGDDILTGGASYKDYLYGDLGDDTLFGGLGRSYLYGGGW